MVIVKGLKISDFPNLLNEFDFEKNKKELPKKFWDPTKIAAGSEQKIWWIGSCGHSFFQIINYRTRNGAECNNKECVIKRIKKTNSKKTDEQKKEILEKIKTTNLSRYGFTSSLQNEDIKQKIKQTNLIKYGVENPMQNIAIQEKSKQTNLIRYGCENPFQNEEIKNKIKSVNLIKYGFEHNMQHEEVKQKATDTFLLRYGVKRPGLNLEIKEKTIKTNLHRYGATYPMQNAIIAQKSSDNIFKKKSYIFPSGRIDFIQGYEHIALDELIKNFNEIDIKTQKIDMPCILYIFEEKEHRYYPDIFIAKENLIIEVKSDYTYNIDEDKNIAKTLATRSLGYNYEVWIYNSQYIKSII